MHTTPLQHPLWKPRPAGKPASSPTPSAGCPDPAQDVASPAKPPSGAQAVLSSFYSTLRNLLRHQIQRCLCPSYLELLETEPCLFLFLSSLFFFLSGGCPPIVPGSRWEAGLVEDQSRLMKYFVSFQEITYPLLQRCQFIAVPISYNYVICWSLPAPNKQWPIVFYYLDTHAFSINDSRVNR